MTNDAVQRLLDIEDLKKLKYRYFRLMDAKQWDEFMGLFTEDLEMNFAFPDEQFYPQDVERTPEGWARTNRDGLLNWVRSVSDGFTTVHIAHMPEIEFTGPDNATGTWSMTDYTRWDASEDQTWYRSYGAHVEDYVRTADGWKIRRTVFSRHDFDVIAMPDEPQPAESAGREGKDGHQ